MKNTLFIALLVFALAGACPAQSQFAIAVGGTDSDYGNSVVQTTDGGYAVTGMTNSFGVGSYDLFLAKFNSTGAVEWVKAVGEVDIDKGYSVVQTFDGGYAVAGYTTSFIAGGDFNLFLVKFTSTGSVDWAKVVGETYYNDHGYSITQTSDGGFAVAGLVGSYGAGSWDFFLMKFSSLGAVEWAKAVGWTDCEEGFSIVQTSDGGYAIVGSTDKYDTGDLLLVKFNSSGAIQWAKVIGGIYEDFGSSVAQTSDGGYVVVGRTESFPAGLNSLFLVKLGSSGVIQWAKTFGGAYTGMGPYENASVVQTSDGGYAVTGYTAAFGAGSWDLFLAKFGSSGSLEWSRAIGGTSGDKGSSLVQTSDGGFAVSGFTYSFGAGSCDLFLVKFDAEGNSCIGEEVFPTVTDVSPTVTNVSPTVTSVSPTITTVTPIVTDVSLIVTDACADTNHAPSFTLCPCPDDTAICLDSTLIVEVLAEDDDGDTVSYSLIDAPEGASMDSTTLIYTPPSTGLFHIIITACDPFDACDTCDFYVAVDSCDTDAVLEKPIKPDAFSLDVQPNPFNSSCAITAPARAEVKIYDLRGNVIATSFGADAPLSPLLTGIKVQSAGRASKGFVWRPDESIPSGIYLIRATFDGQTITRRAILIH
ncbi:T9SS type A sorting domain-containing protein [bacterium]|nr:T9SS type A sorting domain-containing protein [bacterium]